jgi:hypothetical protein
MNEHEVRDALRDAMVASSPPPPMDTGRAVEAGQKAHRRRQTTRAGIVAGLAVVGIAVGATYLPSALNGGAVEAGSGPNGAVPASANEQVPSGSVPSEPSASVRKTGMQWPDGQSDRTASSGPRADKSTDLLPALEGALPAGFTGQGSQDVTARNQSIFVDYAAKDLQVWEYSATTPVRRTDGSGNVGTLHVEVTTRGNGISGGDACELALRAPGINGDCTVVDVGGTKVGLVVSDGTGNENDRTFDQAAAYRYADGTMVFVCQAKAFRDSTQPALGELPLTGEQLAALAADAEFHLD